MKLKLIVALMASATALTACDEAIRGYPADKTVDRGYDSKDLSQLVWGIYVDPTGCDTWIADDGFEGYQVRRLDPYGKPVCSGVAPPTYTAGDFKAGSPFPEPN